MGINWPWNWRLTVSKTIKMTPIKPLGTNFKMTVRVDCAFPECSSPSPSIKYFAHWLSGEKELAFEQASVLPPSTPVACIQNKAKVPSHQSGLFYGFWVASSWIPLSVTIWRQKASSGLLPAPSSLRSKHLVNLWLHSSSQEKERSTHKWLPKSQGVQKITLMENLL